MDMANDENDQQRNEMNKINDSKQINENGRW